MKGVIVRTLEQLVRTNVSPDKWECALEQAGIDRGARFGALDDVDDSVVLKILDCLTDGHGAGDLPAPPAEPERLAESPPFAQVLSSALYDMASASKALPVNDEISPNDEMFLGNRAAYLAVGQSALRCISLATLLCGRDARDIRSILDMPCGHGRVLRTLRAAFPDAHITACDILKDGVEFCASRFGATAVYSHEDPRQIPLRQSFDLIWVGSLLTHFNADRWTEFLSFFHDHLNPFGILVFTVHGRALVRKIRKLQPPGSQAAQLVDEAEQKGFAFYYHPGSTSYGVSLSHPSWVCAVLRKFPSLHLRSYAERAWDNNHDVVSCIRIDD